ncbi:MAG: toll/interleukin-1 receptor domain-containing protein, partial [Sphingomonadales bacterium]
WESRWGKLDGALIRGFARDILRAQLRTPMPRVFISYSHDSEAHKAWVLSLSERLVGNGVDVVLDRWNLQLGSDLAKFMENGLASSERVIIVCTDRYNEKANEGAGGVGYEKRIVTGQLLNGADTTKLIPIIRNVQGTEKLPTFMSGLLYIDWSDGLDDPYQELLHDIYDQRLVRPPLGPNPFATEPAPTSVNPEVMPESARRHSHSTVEFDERFCQAFPGVRGLVYFEDEQQISIRLSRLLQEPLASETYKPIWWWRFGNNAIEDFSITNEGTYIIDHQELDIAKIAAYNSGNYYQDFVYIESRAMQPSGVYPYDDNYVNSYQEDKGYFSEEYAVVDDKYPVSRAEYDDGAAIIDGRLTDIRGRGKSRTRYLTPYNLIIAAHGSPINNTSFDTTLYQYMNNILKGSKTLEELTREIRRLPKRS